MKLSSSYIPRFKTRYQDEIMKALKEEFNYTSVMAIPKLEKIVLNMGVGEATQDKNVLDSAVQEMDIIAAQKSTRTIAKKSVSNFKLREGMPIGVKITLRGNRMYDFLDKLISIAIPRIRDFQGINRNSFDGRGNYSFGIKEQIVFPEINYDKINKVRGLDVTIVTSAKTDAEAFGLLKKFGMPFKDK